MSVFQSSKAYKMFAEDVAQGKAAHAYLFVCPDERNLRPFLREFAKVLFGADRRTCELIDTEMFADCMFVPQIGAKTTVADVRTVIDDCYIKPVEADRKLYVFDNAQDMNAAAQNKLLKVLEEPPVNVYFLLGALNEAAVLPTVKSRTKRLELLSFTKEQIVKELREKYPFCVSPESVAALSGGILGRAEELAEGGGVSAEETALLLANLSPASAVMQSRKCGDRESVAAFLAMLRLVVRDALMLKLGRTDVLSGGGEAALQKAAARYSVSALVNAQEKISETEKNLKFNANISVSIETLLISILEGR